MEERKGETLKLIEVIEKLKIFDLDRYFCDVEEIEPMNFIGERFVYIG